MLLNKSELSNVVKVLISYRTLLLSLVKKKDKLGLELEENIKISNLLLLKISDLKGKI